jgi:AraC-like DNA-binding protein
MTISSEMQSAGVYHSDQSDVSLHQHPGAEIVLVTNGRCQIDIPSLSWSAMGFSGSIFILPGKHNHNQINFGKTSTCYLNAPSVQHFLPTEPLCFGLEDEYERMHRWFADCYDLFMQNDPSCHTLYQSICLRLASLMGQQLEHQQLHAAVASAIELMRQFPLDILDNNSLAKHAGVSSSYILALFRSHFNQGPRAYQISQRMKYAQQLLKDPYLSIDEIASRCGYEDALYFSRQFKKCEGLSPGYWRKSSA